MSISIKAGGVALPSPTELTAGSEIIWSANTGRTASGLMVGDVVAEKQTLAIRWGVLTKAELDAIRSKLTAGFYPVTLAIDRESVTMNYYRGTLSYEILGTFGGTTYYRNAAVNIIQQ